jgi:hypothetical protein
MISTASSRESPPMSVSQTSASIPSVARIASTRRRSGASASSIQPIARFDGAARLLASGPGIRTRGAAFARSSGSCSRICRASASLTAPRGARRGPPRLGVEERRRVEMGVAGDQQRREWRHHKPEPTFRSRPGYKLWSSPMRSRPKGGSVEQFERDAGLGSRGGRVGEAAGRRPSSGAAVSFALLRAWRTLHGPHAVPRYRRECSRTSGA